MERPSATVPGDAGNEPVVSIAELRALARSQGIEADEADLAAVHEFLAVFLPAVGALSQRLPPGEAVPGPSSLGFE